MRYDQYSSRVGEQIIFQPGDAFHIQVVGRLIKKQDIRLGQKKLAKSDPCFLASGKGFYLLGEILF